MLAAVIAELRMSHVFFWRAELEDVSGARSCRAPCIAISKQLCCAKGTHEWKKHCANSIEQMLVISLLALVGLILFATFLEKRVPAE